MSMDQNRNEQVLIALRRITHAIDVHSRSIFLRHNLTGPQLFLMREISRHNGISVEELSSLVEIGVSAVDDILDRLDKRGLIRRDALREPGTIARLFVTDAGQDILRRSPPLLQEHFFLEFEKLNEWEQSLILSTLQRVAAMLELETDLSAAVPYANPTEIPLEPLKGTA
ncbi:MAG: MarR family winged helix-turn-helix transcriptional regulator [Candidatus Latescibacterota bacterium]